jgi:hypothetical protein
MHVLRVVRVLLVVLLVAVVVGAGSSVLSARPDLESAKRDVDSAWATLAPALNRRYVQLTAVNNKLDSVPGPVQSLVDATRTSLAHWSDARRHGGVAAQVAAANDVEAIARRLLATQAASPRVRGNAALLSDVGKYLAMSTSTQTSAAEFNQAVDKYEHERRGPVRAVVASVLGDKTIPVLDNTGIPTDQGPASS